MDVLLSLGAAVGYGASDFLAGLAGRSGRVSSVALVAQPFGLIAALLGLWLIPWSGPTGSSLAWGAISGIGSGLGALALYRGLAVGRMSVVAPLSGIMTALIPAVVGLSMGNRPGWAELLGIVIALPAVALVSWRRGGASGRKSGIPEALIAGACFALLFIALDRAGTGSGTWPLVAGQSVAVCIIGLMAIRSHSAPSNWWRLVPLAVVAGVLGGTGNILFLNAAGRGQLAVVAVLSSLYPAVTVLLARIGLSERFTATQRLGLAVAALAVVLISL